jgi:hypothetical protein
VCVGNPAEFAKPRKTSPPIPHCTLWFRKSRPKITRAVGNCVECVHCNGWQRAIHRRASFRGKQKELVPLDSIARKCYRISNSQTAIPKQKHEGFETNCIGLVWVVITRLIILSTCSLMRGAVGGSVIFRGLSRLAGFVGIQPLSCTKRKNARSLNPGVQVERMVRCHSAKGIRRVVYNTTGGRRVIRGVLGETWAAKFRSIAGLFCTTLLVQAQAYVQI